MRPEIHSNDFGRLCIYIVDSNSNFVVVEIISKKQFVFLCVRSPFTYNVTLHVHLLWLVFTRVLMFRSRCRHSGKKREIESTSISTVGEFWMIHDNLLIEFWKRVFLVSGQW